MPSTFALGTIDRAARIEQAACRSLLELHANEELHVVGWAAATKPEAVFDKLYVVIDEKLWLPVPYGVARPDTAAMRAGGFLRNAGFNVKISTRHVRPGMHSLAIVGTIGSRAQRLAARVMFFVLVKPELTHEIAPPRDSRGRVRVLRDTLPVPRHDGRSSAAVRCSASLLVEGWAMSAASERVPEETRLLLVGPAQTYRAEVQRYVEPEAGVLFGTDAIHSGYRACVDCAEIAPGMYEVWTETRFDRTWTSSPTGRHVEIMTATTCWLPSALPIYCSPFESHFDLSLPASIAQDAEFLVSGRIYAQTPVRGIFARFDSEQTFALTLTQLSHSESRMHGYIFIGLLEPQLSLHEHVLEILVLDANGSGTWRIAQHVFSVFPYELSDVPEQRMEAVVNR